MNYLETINKTALILSLAGVPYTIRCVYDGYQLRFDWCAGDIACHIGIYGHDKGYVESYMFPWDNDDITVLEPKEAARKIIAYYVKLCDE